MRGLPHSCKRSETGKIIRAALGLEEESGLNVCSIAFNCYRESRERVATISFAKVPSALSNGAKDEWRFPLPSSESLQFVDGSEDEDTPSRHVELVIDTHFIGFTSLRSFRKVSDHKFEYVTFL